MGRAKNKQSAVLVVEDDRDALEYFIDHLEGTDATIIWARNLDKARINALDGKSLVVLATSIEEATASFLCLARKLTIIFLDGRINSTQPNTMPLISLFRDPVNDFSGQIIATSCNSDTQKLLVKGGCDSNLNKVRVPRAITEALKL